MPTARPEMMFVPDPVWDCSAIFFTDLYLSDVNISVACPMTKPTSRPKITARAGFMDPRTSFPEISAQTIIM